MSRMKKHQFRNIHLILIVITVLAILSCLGYIYWINSIQLKVNVTPSEVLGDTNTTKSVDCEDFNSNNGIDFSKQLDSIGITFSCPTGWSVTESNSNAADFSIKSPDYKAQSNPMFDVISNGSSIGISGVKTSGMSSLLEEAYSIFNGGEPGEIPADIKLSDVSGQYIEVDGQTAIKFPVDGSMCNYLCKNHVQMIMFRKDNYEYKIDQEFKVGSENPYPEILDSIASSIIFTR